MSSLFRPIKITLAAGEEDSIPVAGRFFSVKEATHDNFEIGIDASPLCPWSAGLSHQLPTEAAAFEALRLKNTDASLSCTFEILVSDGKTYDARLGVIVLNNLETIAKDGTDGTGITVPTGGEGVRGWLSGIYDRLKAAGPIGALLSAMSAKLPSVIGQNAAADSLSVTLASDHGTVTTAPAAVTGGAIEAQTDGSDGSTWVAYASQACAVLDLFNNTGTAIEYRRDGAGVAITIPDGLSRQIRGITDADEIEVRRVDQSATQVTVPAEFYSA
jgi:hypothetical protein